MRVAPGPPPARARAPAPSGAAAFRAPHPTRIAAAIWLLVLCAQPPAAALRRREQQHAHRRSRVRPAPGAPEQLKLSLAGGPDTMVVSWISKDRVPTDGSCFDRPAQAWTSGPCNGGAGCTGSSPPTPFPYPIKAGCELADGEVRYGTSASALGGSVARNASLLFADHDVDANDKPTNVSTPRVVHVVRLAGLKPATRYHYQVRSVGGAWSAVFSFRTLPQHSSSLSLLITADVGAGNIPASAIADAGRGRFDMHLHAGDIAYDMPVNHGATGDAWSNELSNISRSIPFLTWPGNHETDDNHCDYLNFRARFFNQNLTADASRVPSRNSRYFSFEVPGLLHVAGIDTDAYAEPDVDTDGNGYSGQSFFVKEQWEWLKADLASVDRTKTPWLFVVGHHPMYCSSKGEVATTGGKNPAGEPLEMASAGERAVDPSPRLTCRTTPELEQNHIPAWWRERQAQWRAQERGPHATGWCYDCSVGAAMIRNGCSSNATPVDGGVSCTVGAGEGAYSGLRYGLEPLLAEHKVDMYFTGARLRSRFTASLTRNARARAHPHVRALVPRAAEPGGAQLPQPAGRGPHQHRQLRGAQRLRGRAASQLHGHAADGCAVLHAADDR